MHFFISEINRLLVLALLLLHETSLPLEVMITISSIGHAHTSECTTIYKFFMSLIKPSMCE